MTAYPVASTPQAAFGADVRKARTERDARGVAGGAVRFAVCAHPEIFADLDALDERFGMAISEGWAARTSYGHGWQAAIRFWRPDPPLPIASTVKNASNKPVGFAVDLDAAARLALAPTCERTTETLRTYKVRANALKAADARFYDGTAEIVLEGELWAVRLTYWRIPPRLPAGAALSDADREVLARGLNAPLRPSRPQTVEPYGLFAWDPQPVVLIEEMVGGVGALALPEEDEEGSGFRMQDPGRSRIVDPADLVTDDAGEAEPPPQETRPAARTGRGRRRSAAQAAGEGGRSTSGGSNIEHSPQVLR